MPTLYYVMDPMCSWCWAFRPVLRAFADNLPGTVHLQLVMGGLAPDDDTPMPELQRRQIRRIWEEIHVRTGTPFNFDFWSRCTPQRSTWNACRAVIAAATLAKQQAMVEAIQRAYYQQARNPSERDTLIALAVEIGLEQAAFEDALSSPQTEHALQADLLHARFWGVTAFPALVLENHTGWHRLSTGYCDLDHLWQRWRLLNSGKEP